MKLVALVVVLCLTGCAIPMNPGATAYQPVQAQRVAYQVQPVKQMDQQCYQGCMQGGYQFGFCKSKCTY